TDRHGVRTAGGAEVVERLSGRRHAATAEIAFLLEGAGAESGAVGRRAAIENALASPDRRDPAAHQPAPLRLRSGLRTAGEIRRPRLRRDAHRRAARRAVGRGADRGAEADAAV